MKTSFEKIEFKNKQEILSHLEIIINKLNVEAIKKEVENIDREFIRDVIKTYIIEKKTESNRNTNEDNKFKKLI